MTLCLCFLAVRLCIIILFTCSQSGALICSHCCYIVVLMAIVTVIESNNDNINNGEIAMVSGGHR